MAYYYSPFRKEYSKPAEDRACVFCDRKALGMQFVRDQNDQVVENEHYIWIVNWYPKFEGHTMLIPRRHLIKLSQETDEEVVARHRLSVSAAEILQRVYPNSGIEIFLQTGQGSESSIPHLHWHVSPSLPNDSIRGFNKLGQFYTEEEGKEKVLLFPVAIRLAREDLQRSIKDALKEENQ